MQLHRSKLPALRCRLAQILKPIHHHAVALLETIVHQPHPTLYLTDADRLHRDTAIVLDHKEPRCLPRVALDRLLRRRISRNAANGSGIEQSFHVITITGALQFQFKTSSKPTNPGLCHHSAVLGWRCSHRR